ncbi:MAG: sigma-70 family RNA polymerase sigma factor [Kofleriaceae bacterium]
MPVYGALQATISETFVRERASVLATTIAVLGGDFAVAEEVVQDAFIAALQSWSASGIPAEPRAWLITVARRRAIDFIRRSVRHRDLLAGLPKLEAEDAEDGERPDDRLALFFTCCHPALAQEAQVALTLRTLGGMNTDEIARAFLVPTATMAQRLVRAQSKIREARIPYRVPEREEWGERLDAVMTVLYLIFNEGYSATAGSSIVRSELCEDAIRLSRLVAELTDDGEPLGLLALMLLHHSRRGTRTDEHGDLVLLEVQDRSRWDAALIAEGLELVERALRRGPGPYGVQAAIAALHARARTAEDTDWPQIVALYRELLRRQSSAVIALNHAAAVAMVDGPKAGLRLMEGLAEDLDGYHLFHAARADLLRRAGELSTAADAYRRALAKARSEPERRYLERRLREVAGT